MKISSQNIMQNLSNTVSSHKPSANVLHSQDSIKLNTQNQGVLKSNAVVDSAMLSGESPKAKTTTEPNAQLGERAIAFLKGEEGVIFLSEHKLEQMTQVLSRLDKDQQEALIDSNIIANDDFLALAKELDDSQISQFADIANALKVPPKNNNLPSFQIVGFNVKEFADTLSSVDSATRTKVLDRASLEAQKVANPGIADSYDKFGLNSSPSASANDLNNFLKVVNDSQDVAATLDDLALFSDAQQSDLLTVMAGSGHSDKVVEQLSQLSDDLKTDFLSFMSTTVTNVSAYDISLELSPNGKEATKLDHDDHTGKTASKMIEQTLSLMENYDFSELQLDDMASSLNSLPVSDQRAYLTISEDGFAQLIGESKGNVANTDNKISLADADEAIQAIDSVRDSYQARELVYKSRMGEAHATQDSGMMYELKNQSDTLVDQKNTVELLVADAFSSAKSTDSEDAATSQHTEALASSLLSLDTDTRDELSASLSSLIPSSGPLNQLDEESLATVLNPLMQRSHVLAETKDAKALMAVHAQVTKEDKLVSDQEFWQAAQSSGSKIDDFVQILSDSNLQNQQLTIEFFAANNSSLAEQQSDIDSMEKRKEDFFSSLTSN